MLLDTPISEIDYDEDRRKLFVRFEGGVEHVYVGVPPAVHRSFATAPARAAFFEERINGCYPFNRLNS